MKNLIFSIALSVICVILLFVFAYVYSITGDRLYLALGFGYLMILGYGLFTIISIWGCL